MDLAAAEVRSRSDAVPSVIEPCLRCDVSFDGHGIGGAAIPIRGLAPLLMLLVGRLSNKEFQI